MVWKNSLKSYFEFSFLIVLKNYVVNSLESCVGKLSGKKMYSEKCTVYSVQ